MLDSPKVQGAVRKAIAAVIGFMLMLVLLIALLISGFYLLVKAATLAMSPFLGEAGALAVSGFVCFTLLGLFFYRMTRPASTTTSEGSATDSSGGYSPIALLRELIRKNPLESVFAAFAVGIVEHSDPQLKALLMEGGMVLMKEAEAEYARPPEAANEPAAPVPEDQPQA